MKAEQSQQEKQQATPSIQRRISQKQRKENLESYRESFLVPRKIIDRKATYISRSTWERLEFIVRRLGDYEANVSSFFRTHCSPTLGRVRRQHRTVEQTLISVFRAISNEMDNRHSQKVRRTSNGSQS